jgi:hypothetical protein
LGTEIFMGAPAVFSGATMAQTQDTLLGPPAEARYLPTNSQE